MIPGKSETISESNLPDPAGGVEPAGDGASAGAGASVEETFTGGVKQTGSERVWMREAVQRKETQSLQLSLSVLKLLFAILQNLLKVFPLPESPVLHQFAFATLS
jgi:hypothetical protein